MNQFFSIVDSFIMAPTGPKNIQQKTLEKLTRPGIQSQKKRWKILKKCEAGLEESTMTQKQVQKLVKHVNGRKGHLF